MSFKKFLSLLVLVALCATMFVACGKNPTPTSASGLENTTTDSKSGEKVTINFEQFSGTGDNEKFILEMIDAYTAENPNVTIKHQFFGYSDYFTQLMAKVSSGKVPDVFELNYENFVTYAKKDALMPLDDVMNSQSIDTSIYNEMALKAFTSGGKQYGVPNSFSDVVLIYNKELFDKAKIDYPTDSWTWENAMAAAEKIRALGNDIYGYYQPLSFFEFYKIVQQNGGSLISSNSTKFTIDSPENVEALQYLIDMQNKSNVMPTPVQLERTSNADWDLFKTGRLGMIVTGCWAFPDFTRDCGFAWDIAVEPGHKKQATHFFSNGYVVSKNSKVSEEAAKFMTFISSNKKATQIRIDAGWELPPVNDKEIIDSYLKITPPDNRQAVFKSLDYLVTPPVITQFTELQDIVGRHLNDAAAGTISAKDALTAMQAECIEKIDLSK